ncbi:MAG: gamma-glutamyl-gamma-aminobutyrate hydrolase family protein [Candidatus Omnitrophica bacterium]|nr:gamma-glutamyl-gamma-aminobutyrate hydrolase family protein [Candidatus Omnitrophota bacterium]
MTTRKVLFIQPIGCEGPGLIEETRPSEFEAEICRPVIGQPIPGDADPYAALVLLGGPMGVYETEKYPWLLDLFELIRQGVERDLPILGICLGSQALAAVLGAEVKPSGLQEIGWHPVTLNSEGQRDPLLSLLPSPIEVFHWHGDRWELPPGATLLASSAMCDHQAFRVGQHQYGFQFHIEVTPETPPIWAEAYHEDLLRHPGVPSPEDISVQSAQYGPILEQYSRVIFTKFWQMVHEHSK